MIATTCDGDTPYTTRIAVSRIRAIEPMQRRSESYTAMTVNERLSMAGLTRVFDAAARDRDKAVMLELLARVAMTPEQAAQTAEAILRNPRRYGY